MVVLSSVIAGLAMQPAAPVELQRKFVKGENLSYSFASLVTTEVKQPGVNTFLPRDYGFEYDFTVKVTGVDENGYGILRYDRPKTVFITGEYADERETRVAERGGNLKLELKVSPINELIEIKDLAAKPKTTKMLRAMAPQGYTDAIGGQFLADIFRMTLMVGSLDSSLDFAPKLPVLPVAVGKTWKKTVSFQPQTTGNSKQQTVQRLDYTFTYHGVKNRNNVPYRYVTAELKLETDLGAYINQQMGAKPEQTGIRGLKTKFDQKIDFYLDQKTLRTVYAEANSKGSTQLEVVGQTAPLEEQRFTGRSTLRLVKATP